QRGFQRHDVEIADVVFAHHLDGLPFEYAVAVERAAIEQHAQEADVVRRRGVKPPAPIWNSGSCAISNGTGVSDPSAPRACMPTRRSRCAAPSLNPVSFMPSGVKM